MMDVRIEGRDSVHEKLTRIAICPCGARCRFHTDRARVVLKCAQCGRPILYERISKSGYQFRSFDRDYRLFQADLTIGRAADCSIRIPLREISNVHCRLYWRDDRYEIEDCGSSNGTFVNEQRLEQHEKVLLHAGDLIRLGSQYFRYLVPAHDRCASETARKQIGPRPEQERGRAVLDVQSESSRDPRDPDDDPFLGREIAGCTVLRVLSQGGMGRVYLAHQVGLDRNVVFKTLLPDQGTSPKAVERFQREIMTCARMNHANVVQIFEAGSHAGINYVIMEYFDGRDLFDYTEDHCCSLSEVLSIGRQVSAAVEEAHGMDIVHRDIKPENILINDRGLVKVIDFGIVKALDDSSMTNLTTTGVLLGSFPYMAPEQFESPEEIDETTDVYGVGAVLYFLLTGRPPYMDAPLSAMCAQMRKGFAKPRTLNPDIPPDMERVLLKALAEKQQDRFQSAIELQKALRKLTKMLMGAGMPGEGLTA